MIKRLLLLFFINLSNSFKMVTLTNENVILVKNEINRETVNYAIEKLHTAHNPSEMIIFLDSQGGNVEAGLLLISEIMKYNMTCITSKAYSMAFAILQSCRKRYILPTARLMQHQITFGIKNSLKQINSYVSYVNQINNYLCILQSTKIGINTTSFLEKTNSDWWLFSENAIRENVADEIINIECTKKLFATNYTQIIGNIEVVYSNCPLIFKEKDIILTKKNKMDVKNILENKKRVLRLD